MAAGGSSRSGEQNILGDRRGVEASRRKKEQGFGYGGKVIVGGEAGFAEWLIVYLRRLINLHPLVSSLALGELDEALVSFFGKLDKVPVSLPEKHDKVLVSSREKLEDLFIPVSLSSSSTTSIFSDSASITSSIVSG